MREWDSKRERVSKRKKDSVNEKVCERVRKKVREKESDIKEARDNTGSKTE